MTKEEAINEIECQSKMGEPIGFQILSIDKEDIEVYAPDHVRRFFNSLTSDQQKKWLSWLADEMMTTFEETGEYGCKRLMLDTMEYVENEGETVAEEK